VVCQSSANTLEVAAGSSGSRGGKRLLARTWIRRSTRAEKSTAQSTAESTTSCSPGSLLCLASLGTEFGATGHWMCGLSNGAAALALKHGGAPPRLGLGRGERTWGIDLLACGHDYATYPFIFLWKRNRWIGIVWRGWYHGVGVTDVMDSWSDDRGCAPIHKNSRSNPRHWLVILRPLSNHTPSLWESSKRNPVFFINKPAVQWHIEIIARQYCYLWIKPCTLLK
jgi:hypothetical protein